MFPCPEGEEKHEEMKPLRIRVKTQRRTAALQARYQTQFGLFTMPECPMARAQFLFFFGTDGNKKPPQQINFPGAPHPGGHGYAARLHVRRSKSQRGGKGKSETRNSKQFPPFPEVILGHLGNMYFSHTLGRGWRAADGSSG